MIHLQCTENNIFDVVIFTSIVTFYAETLPVKRIGRQLHCYFPNDLYGKLW